MKTISVYDAVKLATPGPLTVQPTYQGFLSDRWAGSPFSLDGANGFQPCVILGDGLNNRGVARANATLLAHFFNHGPALLAMLEEFVKLQEPFRKQLDANETEILDESIALIAKASKVEIEE